MKTLAVPYMTKSPFSSKNYRLNEKPSNTWQRLFTIAAVVGWISFGVVAVRPDWIVNVLLNLFK